MKSTPRSNLARALFSVCLLTLWGSPIVLPAQSSPATDTGTPAAPAADATPMTADSPKSGTRRALVLCGMSGDAEHHQQFVQSIESIRQGLIEWHDFQAENIQILWADEITDKDPEFLRTGSQPATREGLTTAAQTLRQTVAPEDAVWVIVLGHAHFDGKHSWLNIAGPDLQQFEFGELFAGLTCQEQVFLMTTGSSGYFLKPLAQPGRVVITATEADLEVNETYFPQKLARLLASPPNPLELDVDRDGNWTLFDLYLFAAKETAAEYAAGQLLATEHALLDDTGDGRGTELQIDYLTEELGGRKRPGNTPVPPPQGDGKRSRQIPLRLPDSFLRPLSPPPPPLPEVIEVPAT